MSAGPNTLKEVLEQVTVNFEPLGLGGLFHSDTIINYPAER